MHNPPINEHGYERQYHRNTPYMDPKNIESQRKINFVLSLIRQGWSRTRIMEKLYDEWGLKRTQTCKYYHDAILKIADKYEEEAANIRFIQLERIEDILKSALESKDRKSALKALDMINKLHSLYVEKQEIKADVQTWDFTYANEEKDE